MTKTHSFTGHRPDKLGGYSPRAHRTRVDFAKSVIRSEGVTIGISGMALGWDQAVAQACIEDGIPFIAAVPFEGQESRWPADSRRAYERILRRAEKVVIVSAIQPETNGAAAGMLHKRNEWMVDHSSDLIALWNGDQSGGTFSCVRYAERVSRNIINCWREWQFHLQFGAILG